MSVRTNIIKYSARWLSLSWLTGPIFDKELRVSSRRRRNYVLRFGYLVILTGFMILVWGFFTQNLGYGSQASQVSRMSEAGKFIITYVVWFQFCATQLLAVIMLSNSISDEIYHLTLGLLMTTPINSFQIVMGKLFSKLLQLVLLLAISLPLLVIVRVFGGVPANFIISSLAVTLTAVIFAGALSLFFSIHSRRSYEVIIKTLFVLGVLYVFVPFIAACLLYKYISVNEFFWALSYVNPLVIMYYHTQQMLLAGAVPWLSSTSWPLHCGTVLAASMILLFLSARVVRRVALSQACGQVRTLKPQKPRRRLRRGLPADEPEFITEPLHRIDGSAMIWKELKTPLLRGGRRSFTIGLAAGIIALLLTYAVCAYQNSLGDVYTHAWYAAIFVILGSVCTVVLAATSVTTEKESRCWPILLGATLNDWHILGGKALSVFKRCLPIWLFLVGHVLLFTLVGDLHPIALVHLTILMVWLMVFLAAAGLYFSACFKRTVTAVIASFSLVLILWGIIPMVMGLVGQFRPGTDYINAYLKTNPVIQVEVIMTSVGESNANQLLDQLVYRWPFYEKNLAGSFTMDLMVSLLIYLSCSVLLAWRAKVRFRRNVF
ncbi:ABC transporter permease [Planctomycetota bacterium]